VRTRVRASNRASDRAILQNIDDRIATMEQAYLEAAPNDAAAELRTWAALGVEHGVGNCQVQASVAFDYLARMDNHPKLELMSLYANNFQARQVTTPVTGTQENVDAPDHVFVVIGRAAGNIQNFETWNRDAVVCDPWAKRCYFALYLETEMEKINRVSGGVTRTVQMFELAANAQW
jgi:hypothetical protein